MNLVFTDSKPHVIFTFKKKKKKKTINWWLVMKTTLIFLLLVAPIYFTLLVFY